jgi:hypothetical protein
MARSSFGPIHLSSSQIGPPIEQVERSRLAWDTASPRRQVKIRWA